MIKATTPTMPTSMQGIEKIPPAAPGKRERYRHPKIEGLWLRVTDKGSKSFYFEARLKGGKPIPFTIGAFPKCGLDLAEKEAKRIAAMLAQGIDPREEKRKAKADPTFGELFDWYVEVHACKKKDGGKEDRQKFQRHLKELAKVKASQVTRSQIILLRDNLAKKYPVEANRLHALIKGVYSVALEHRSYDLKDNPAKGIKMLKESKRKRKLEAAEVAPLFAAIDADDDADTRDFLRLALFTGARKSNVLGMRWDQINERTRVWTIPAVETKSGEQYDIPLPAQAQAILQARKERATGRPWVFPSPRTDGHLEDLRNGLKRVLERAGIENLHIHDLRRTLSSYMRRAGVFVDDIGEVLGHSPQNITSSVYALQDLEVLRTGMERGIELMLSHRD